MTISLLSAAPGWWKSRTCRSCFTTFVKMDSSTMSRQISPPSRMLCTKQPSDIWAGRCTGTEQADPPDGKLRLRPDLNRSPIGNQIPNLINFGIRNRDAPIGPVLGPVDLSQPPEAVGQSVDHNVATRRYAAPGGLAAIFFVGVGNVDRFVEPALRVS